MRNKVRLDKVTLGYIRLGLAFFTISRELRVVERNGLQIRDPEGISYISNASNTQKC